MCLSRVPFYFPNNRSIRPLHDTVAVLSGCALRCVLSLCHFTGPKDDGRPLPNSIFKLILYLCRVFTGEEDLFKALWLLLLSIEGKYICVYMFSRVRLNEPCGYSWWIRWWGCLWVTFKVRCLLTIDCHAERAQIPTEGHCGVGSSAKGEIALSEKDN